MGRKGSGTHSAGRPRGTGQRFSTAFISLMFAGGRRNRQSVRTVFGGSLLTIRQGIPSFEQRDLRLDGFGTRLRQPRGIARGIDVELPLPREWKYPREVGRLIRTGVCSTALA